MTYTEALEYIHSFLKFGSRPGLERVKLLAEKLGDPQKGLRTVHIAGTNGKGSTSLMLQSAITAAGYKCGLYISPFVTDFRERIQIDGEYISKDDLCYYVNRIKEITDTLPEDELPTEFEVITAAAFSYFAEKKVDFAVIEVGLGGRLDATNIIEAPQVSVITDIGLDHTKILGNTIEQIAFEKCGIIKNGCPVVTSALQKSAALDVIKGVAEKRNAPLYIAPAPENVRVTRNGTEFDLRGERFKTAMPGYHQAINASLVLTALNAANINVGEKAIKAGLSAVMPARCEMIGSDPLILLDGSHNPAGGAALADVLTKLNVRGAVMLLGMMADKDTDGYIKAVAPFFDNAVTVTVPGNPRAISSEKLLQKCSGLIKNVFAAPDCGAALDMVFSISEGNAPIVVCGSLYLAGDIRQELLKRAKKR